MRRYLFIIFAGLWLVISCAEQDPLEAQLSAWRDAGLETTSFADVPAQKLNAISCFAGEVGGIHVTLCDYPDENSTQQSTKEGHQVIGNATGVVLARGEVLLLATDRDGVDPGGKTINTICRVFWEGMD